MEGFTRKHGVHKLVYYEAAGDAESATTRERQLKKWKGKWKIRLVDKNNPKWTDLYEVLLRE